MYCRYSEIIKKNRLDLSNSNKKRSVKKDPCSFLRVFI